MESFAFIPELTVSITNDNNETSSQSEAPTFQRCPVNDESIKQWIHAYSLTGEFTLRITELRDPLNFRQLIKSCVVHSPAVIRLDSSGLPLDILYDCLDFGVQCIQIDLSRATESEADVSHIAQSWILEHANATQSEWPFESIPASRLLSTCHHVER